MRNAEGTLEKVKGPFKTQDEAADAITDGAQVVTGSNMDGWYVAVQAPASKVVETLLDDEPSPTANLKWVTPKEARPFVPEQVLELVPTGAKIAIIPGGETSDCWIYNDFKGGVRVYINGKWTYARDEHDAFNKFLEQDHWAS